MVQSARLLDGVGIIMVIELPAYPKNVTGADGSELWCWLSESDVSEINELDFGDKDFPVSLVRIIPLTLSMSHEIWIMLMFYHYH